MDWTYLEHRWQSFWNMDNHDRPLINLCAPSGLELPRISPPATLAARWEDAQYAVAAHIRGMKATAYLAETPPIMNPNLGPDILGAICGCEITYGETTSWAEHCVDSWDTFPEIRFDANNPWFRKIEAITREAAKQVNGDYLVAITDLHPGTDALVSLRGPEALCCDVYDHPEAILRRSDEVFEVHRQVYDRLDAIISTRQKGTTNWMGIWHPSARWYVVGSDFSCMVSADDFERFVMPSLVREIDMLNGSIYHLDGPGALRHLDRILEIDRLNGVQWVYGDGQPSAVHWIDVYKKIQRAGKLVEVICRPEEVEAICEALHPEGVHLQVGWVRSEAEAQDLIHIAERASQRRKRSV